ncbi:DUF3624 domain-containing protein [Psychromonas sp. psych-6C06]|uniref:DUF3624 domain-containing protein n=1 Tax=Psychromonas sp. psych-6C06 TaxID=2058089 RepID=UPI000C31C10B|nr:DUF3624 domain-containing protein [Psychromonas sp. psych-6C06]PKF61519.1 DUF3624 domain-containing protein [Psychromonas sp. psych-6C06]
MACKDCESNIWKQKLGRCKRCMWINFILLLTSALGSYFMFQAEPKSVQSIALFFTLFCSGILMLLHSIAWLYYYFTKASKHNLK